MQRKNTWNQLHDPAEIKDESFLEAKEQQQSCHRNQHDETRNADEECRSFEVIIQNRVEIREGPRAHVSALGVVWVTVLENAQMPESRAVGRVSDPLGLDESDQVQNAPK